MPEYVGLNCWNAHFSDFDSSSDVYFFHKLEFQKFFLTNQIILTSVQIAKNYPHIIFGKVSPDGYHIP